MLLSVIFSVNFVSILVNFAKNLLKFLEVVLLVLSLKSRRAPELFYHFSG